MICHLCGVLVTLAQAGYYRVHYAPGGGRCPASGMTPDMALASKRSFTDRDNDQSTLTVIDDHDTIQLHNRIDLGTIRTDLWFSVQPHDVRRLIAELTEIADKRGL